jgi:hypothetical protein
MDCYQSGCAERPAWQLRLVHRPSKPGEELASFQVDVCACWSHRAQLLRSYGGARGALKIASSLRDRGVDPRMAERTVASMTPIFR